MHSSRMHTAHSSSCRGGDVCLSACWDTPLGVGLETPPVWAWRLPPGVGLETPLGVGLENPLGVGLENPSRPNLLTSPPGCGPGDPPQGQTPQLSPWVWAWRPARHAGIPPPGDLLHGMLGYHLQCMLGYQAPPVNRITDTCKNITLPQLRCGR